MLKCPVTSYSFVWVSCNKLLVSWQGGELLAVSFSRKKIFSMHTVMIACGNKMPTRCNRGLYCRSYCLLNMFRAPLCPSSGAQEYYTVVAACGISCCGFQVARNTTGSNHRIILLSSWWWAYWCPKHVEQAIRSAIKTSVASSWHFISTYALEIFSFYYNAKILQDIFLRDRFSLNLITILVIFLQCVK